MTEVAPFHGVVRFGAFEVDFRKAEVRKHGFRIRLQDQPFHVLQILLERPGELVTREELQRQIWPADTFVDFEKGLNNAIKRLRDALGDAAEQPRFIETHARRGYRFIGSVTAPNGADRPQEGISVGEVAVPARSRPLYGRLAIGVVLSLAFVATLFGLDIGGLRQRLSLKASPPVIHSLAVLPLTNLSNDPNQEYFSDGMTDALITDLAQIGSLKVISRTSTMQYKQTKKTLPEIARELNVDGIVEGTVQRSGDRVRITAQLIQGPADKHLWANSYERDASDIFALEREITGDIARQVQARLATQNQPPTGQPRVTNLKALDAYLQGQYQLNNYRNGYWDEEKREAAKYFQQAIDADPNFAAAYVGLTQAHSDLLWPSSGDAEIVKRSLARALELDPGSSDARLALGEFKWCDWDWSGAEEEYRRAISLSPNSANAHNGLCSFLFSVGRGEEVFRDCQMAQELDPSHDHLAEALYWRGDYDHAISQTQFMLQRDPDNDYYHYGLYRYYAAKGMQAESLQELEKVFSLIGMPEAAARIHRASQVSGYLVGFRQATREFEDLHSAQQAYVPVNLALLYTISGDKERAFYWLEDAYEHHNRHRLSLDMGLEQLRIDPLFKPLRTDPRYADLLRRIGLPP